MQHGTGTGRVEEGTAVACDLGCGAVYPAGRAWQRDLHHYASEKGILPTCGRGAERKARAANAEAA